MHTTIINKRKNKTQQTHKQNNNKQTTKNKQTYTRKRKQAKTKQHTHETSHNGKQTKTAASQKPIEINYAKNCERHPKKASP